MSPTLFSIYINDLADEINTLQCGVQFDEATQSILLYADDIALAAPDEVSLQRMLDVLCKWCQIWGLVIIKDKTKVIYFRNGSTKTTHVTFHCGSDDLCITDSFRYFSIWLNEHLDMKKTVKESCKSTGRALSALYTKFICAGGMSYEVYTKLYTSLVEPALFYGAGICAQGDLGHPKYSM